MKNENKNYEKCCPECGGEGFVYEIEGYVYCYIDHRGNMVEDRAEYNRNGNIICQECGMEFYSEEELMDKEQYIRKIKLEKLLCLV